MFISEYSCSKEKFSSFMRLSVCSTGDKLLLSLHSPYCKNGFMGNLGEISYHWFVGHCRVVHIKFQNNSILALGEHVQRSEGDFTKC